MPNPEYWSSVIETRISSEVRVSGEEYLVETEVADAAVPHIRTRILHAGEVTFRSRHDCGDVRGTPGMEMRVMELMLRQHQAAIGRLTAGAIPEIRTPADYLEDLRVLLRKKNNRSALLLLQESLAYYPDDPFLLSYYGCLESIVNRSYAFGIETCRTALERLKDRLPFGEDFFYPLFYLNLGRALLASGEKEAAIREFRNGLSFDEENGDLQWEMKKLGLRKKPVIPLLKRSHPVNKYIGLLVHRIIR